MNVEEFPGCCTARVLTHFGEEGEAEYSMRVPRDNTPSRLQDTLKNLKREGKGIVTAILTQNQGHGVALLEGAGFKSMGWVSKKAHPNNKIALFYLSLEDWEPSLVKEEWIRNRGSKSVPVKARGKRVVIRRRDGGEPALGRPSEDYCWVIKNHRSDIMSYKITGDA